MLFPANIEVLTRTGYQSFKGARRITRLGRIDILLDDGTELKCTDNHRIMTVDGWKLAVEITSNDRVMKTNNCYVKVFDVQRVLGEYQFYDLVDVEGGAEYFTNDIVSHNCEFLGSSNTLISPTKLKMLTYSTPLKTSEDIKVYLEPAQGRLYTLIADTSRALGLDYSAFVIIDITEFPYQVVAVYRNNTISSLLYPSIIYQFAKHYNMAYCLIESNDIGKQVADILYYEHEYENIFYTSSDQRSGQRITGGFSGSALLGVKTSTTVKRVGCSNFKSMVENDKIILNDFDLIQELYRFSAKGNSYEAEEGHDDLVMPCVLFSWMIEQPFVKELTSTDLRQRIYNDQENMIEEALTPFGIVDDGQDVFEEQPVIAVQQNNDNWLLN